MKQPANSRLWLLAKGLAFLGVSVFFVFGALRLRTDSSIHSMLVDGDPAVRVHAEFSRQFGSDEVLSIAIPFDDPLSRDALSSQGRIVERLYELDDVEEVRSLVTEADVLASDDSLVVQSILSLSRRIEDAGAAEEWLRRRVRENSIWKGWLVSADLSVAALQVRLADDEAAQFRRRLTFSKIKGILSEELGTTAYFLAGHPFMKNEIAVAIEENLMRLLPISVVVIFVVLSVLLGSVSISAAIVLAVLASVVWMLGAMGWLGLEVTALTNAAPAILVALSTTYFLHCVSGLKGLRAGIDESSSREIARRVQLPIWLAALTTAIGFASLALSSVPIVRGFGISLSVGVVLAAVIATQFLPLIVSWVPHYSIPVAFDIWTRLAATVVVLARLALRFRTTLVSLSLLLGLCLGWALTDLRVDSSGPRRFADDSEFVRSAEFYRQYLSGDVLETAYFSTEEGDFLDVDRLRRLQYFVTAAVELPGIDKAVSLVDYLQRILWAVSGEPKDNLRLPESREASSQLLLLYESGGGLDDLADVVTDDRKTVRVAFAAEVPSSASSGRLGEELRALAERYLPAESGPHSVVSTEMLMSRAADTIAVEQFVSASVALILILVVVGVFFRSIWIALALLIPNVLPVLVVFGAMSALSVPLSDATSLIAATVIGMAVDGSVHIAYRFQFAQKRTSDVGVALLYSLLSSAPAVVGSAIVVVCGFLVLLSSTFRSIAELGALTAVSLVACLAADLLVLPACLSAVVRGGNVSAALAAFHEGRWVVGQAERLGSTFRVLDPLGQMAGASGVTAGADAVLWLQGGEARSLSPE